MTRGRRGEEEREGRRREVRPGSLTRHPEAGRGRAPSARGHPFFIAHRSGSSDLKRSGLHNFKQSRAVRGASAAVPVG